jgi:hypothetical protein
MKCLALCAICLLLAASVGCDRNTEPFSAEEPRQPDLASIFPEGADRASQPLAELPPSPGGPTSAPPQLASSSQEPITGTLVLADALAGRVPPGAVLFLIARTGVGGPPLAVKRIADLHFPMEFRLGPEDRMIQQLPFAGPLAISVRVDRDGNASTRETGDLVGAAEGLHPTGATGVTVTIDEVFDAATAPPAAARAAGAPPPGGSAPIEGTITLAPTLASQPPAGAVLFLIARTASAGPPLAVKRIPNPQFPLEFSIGPDDRMIQTRPFAGDIRLSARLDGDGNATSRSPGDLQGEAGATHAPGATGVELVIDTVLP